MLLQSKNIYSAVNSEHDTGFIKEYNRSDIVFSGVNSLCSFLNKIPEVGVLYDSCHKGSTPSVTAYGLSDALSRRFKILIDGHSMHNNLNNVNYIENLPITLEEIDRIIVKKGPSIDNDSLLGYIDIRTAEPFMMTNSVSLVHSERGQGVSASVTGNAGSEGSFYVTGNHSRFIESGDEGSVKSASIKYSHQTDKGEYYGLRVGYTGRENTFDDSYSRQSLMFAGNYGLVQEEHSFDAGAVLIKYDSDEVDRVDILGGGTYDKSFNETRLEVYGSHIYNSEKFHIKTTLKGYGETSDPGDYYEPSNNLSQESYSINLDGSYEFSENWHGHASISRKRNKWRSDEHDFGAFINYQTGSDQFSLGYSDVSRTASTWENVVQQVVRLDNPYMGIVENVYLAYSGLFREEDLKDERTQKAYLGWNHDSIFGISFDAEVYHMTVKDYVMPFFEYPNSFATGIFGIIPPVSGVTGLIMDAHNIEEISWSGLDLNMKGSLSSLDYAAGASFVDNISTPDEISEKSLTKFSAYLKANYKFKNDLNAQFYLKRVGETEWLSVQNGLIPEHDVVGVSLTKEIRVNGNKLVFSGAYNGVRYQSETSLAKNNDGFLLKGTYKF